MLDSPQHVLPRACHLIQQGIDQQHHLGMQVSVSLRGEVLADFALGENYPGSPLSADTLMLWLSAGKPLTAVAVLQLVERGRLELFAPVARVIEEFGQAGKSEVTFAHLLTHTAGLKPIATGWPHVSWDQIIAKICGASLRYGATAGSYPGYDPARSWFILGEAVRRIDGRTIDQYVREEICMPAGMDNTWMAMPEEVFHENQDRMGISYNTDGGALTPTKGHLWETISQPSPGGSLRGPIRELGRFYECLLGTSKVSILQPETVREVTSRQRRGQFDETFQHKVDFGWGVIINSNKYGPETIPYGFGRYASEGSFGHGGAQSSIGFADPDHQLVVSAVANGMPGESTHNNRFRKLNSAIYEDLDLAGRAATSGG